MAKKKVIVSFDYEVDGHYRSLLSAWSAHPSFEFEFHDLTPKEIQSDDVSRIKAVLTQKIKAAHYTLVIVGKEANKKHAKSKEIGHKNYMNFEIYQSKAYGNKLVAVKIDKSYDAPDELYNAGATWAYGFTQDAILKAIADHG